MVKGSGFVYFLGMVWFFIGISTSADQCKYIIEDPKYIRNHPIPLTGSEGGTVVAETLNQISFGFMKHDHILLDINLGKHTSKDFSEENVQITFTDNKKHVIMEGTVKELRHSEFQYSEGTGKTVYIRKMNSRKIKDDDFDEIFVTACQKNRCESTMKRFKIEYRKIKGSYPQNFNEEATVVLAETGKILIVSFKEVKDISSVVFKQENSSVSETILLQKPNGTISKPKQTDTSTTSLKFSDLDDDAKGISKLILKLPNRVSVGAWGTLGGGTWNNIKTVTIHCQEPQNLTTNSSQKEKPSSSADTQKSLHQKRNANMRSNRIANIMLG